MSWGNAMVPVICPTVTAYDEHTFRQQVERVAHFVERLHLDFMDGDFTPKKSPSIGSAWWPAGVKADFHIMYRHPNNCIAELTRLKPNLVILHAEAEGDFFAMADQLKAAGIKVGLAILKHTPISKIEPALEVVDHILIFSGDLGSFGGRADVNLLEKVEAVKVIDPNIEVGWDGGINDKNASQLIEGGVDVLNVGDFIQRAEHPGAAYATLKEIALKANNGSKTN